MLMAAPSSSASCRRLPTERPTQHHEQLNQNQPPLNCPRCESSNTKFCYYNNYSLSQPRHFCKACKRYWTRGGTLRNVPLDGGCRKNRRMRRPFASLAGAVPTSATPSTSMPPLSVVTRSFNVDVSASRSTGHVNSLFFDMGGAPHPRLHPTIGLSPHLHSVIEYSSSGFVAGDRGGCGDDNYIQALVASAPVHSDGFCIEGIRCSNTGIVSPILESSDPTTTLTPNVPSMASLLASTIHHQKFFTASLQDFQTNSDDF